jgi:hypothetical protein
MYANQHLSAPEQRLFGQPAKVKSDCNAVLFIFQIPSLDWLGTFLGFIAC